jgi:hypothetical protein
MRRIIIATITMVLALCGATWADEACHHYLNQDPVPRCSTGLHCRALAQFFRTMHLALVSIQEKLIACVSARALLTFDLFQAPNFHRAHPAPLASLWRQGEGAGPAWHPFWHRTA